ncbi:YtxH domain-containing protein [Clostridium sp. Sa3CUN1]|uniref:YtxH domain-containing protein n=1 Tax=Clostridium gallinarum TaxID=2762246 RepID=A0ABR8Q3H6_9CLOT|nr:YtxH domain-containing protein [Clostridium gallinarum]MBD7914889.1 YtxH domain-containing protein [Clostridium gallinarum]
MALYNLIEKKRREKKRKLVKTATVSTIVGGALGVLSGVLLAPKSGKETRNDIKEKVDEVKSITVEQTKNLKSNVEEAKSKIKDYLKDKKDGLKKEELVEVVEDIEESEEL